MMAKFVTVKVEVEEREASSEELHTILIRSVDPKEEGFDAYGYGSFINKPAKFIELIRLKKRLNIDGELDSYSDNTFITWSKELEEFIGVPMSIIDKEISKNIELTKQSRRILRSNATRIGKARRASLFNRLKYLFTSNVRYIFK